MKKFEKVLCLAVVILMVLAFWLISGYMSSINATGRTEILCKEYAEFDHSKEIAESRRQWLLEQGYDYNEDFDWYQSCLNHSSKS